MKSLQTWMLFLFVTGVCSCSVVRETPKYAFSDGYYISKMPGKNRSKVYVENSDSIHAFAVFYRDKTILVDTTYINRSAFPVQSSQKTLSSAIFNQSSFDIDFLTIPFKYRLSTRSLPAQFNTNLNGAVYLGYRVDYYQIWYKKTPVQGYKRQITHYGFSYGLFNGLGGTAMNPWVTENQISSEYDGVVWSKGLTGIIGINNFTIGLALGWDHLLDKNNGFWIYQGKPWLGLAFGLNLN